MKLTNAERLLCLLLIAHCTKGVCMLMIDLSACVYESTDGAVKGGKFLFLGAGTGDWKRGIHLVENRLQGLRV